MNILSNKSDVILNRFMKLHPKLIDLSLDRVHELLKKLGNPHHHLPPVVHIAGTNGKGSTLAYIENIMCNAGYQVARYTSPHLKWFHERISFNGTPISEQDLCNILEQCEGANANNPITYFEITTVAAFLAFANSNADILLLETGLGGRLDATNVVDRPALSILSSISLDHMQFLGNSVEKIAGEKAGIIKENVPVLAHPRHKGAENVIISQSELKNAPLHLYGRDWVISDDNHHIAFLNKNMGEGGNIPLPKPKMLGAHQIDNASLAVMACHILKDCFSKITDMAIENGIKSTSWPGRLQNLNNSKIGTELKGWDIWIDGGHNEAAGKILSHQLDDWKKADNLPVTLIFAMLSTKDSSAFLRPLCNKIERVIAVSIPGESNSLSPEQAEEIAKGEGMDVIAQKDISDAISYLKLQKTTEKPGRLLICGSLYLVGDILRRYA